MRIDWIITFLYLGRGRGAHLLNYKGNLISTLSGTESSKSHPVSVIFNKIGKPDSNNAIRVVIATDEKETVKREGNDIVLTNSLTHDIFNMIPQDDTSMKFKNGDECIIVNGANVLAMGRCESNESKFFVISEPQDNLPKENLKEEIVKSVLVEKDKRVAREILSDMARAEITKQKRKEGAPLSISDLAEMVEKQADRTKDASPETDYVKVDKKALEDTLGVFVKILHSKLENEHNERLNMGLLPVPSLSRGWEDRKLPLLDSSYPRSSSMEDMACPHCLLAAGREAILDSKIKKLSDELVRIRNSNEIEKQINQKLTEEKVQKMDLEGKINKKDKNDEKKKKKEPKKERKSPLSILGGGLASGLGSLAKLTPHGQVANALGSILD